MNIDNLHIILNHFYEQEIDFIEEEYNCILPKNLSSAILFCEQNNLSDNIGYNLMILKQDLQNGKKDNKHIKKDIY